MSLAETVLEGTSQSDGTLVLDEPTKLPAGRVQAVLRQESEITLPPDDPFWQRMKKMWDAQNANGHVPRSLEEIGAERREMKEGWARHQEAIERLQEESRRPR